MRVREVEPDRWLVAIHDGWTLEIQLVLGMTFAWWRYHGELAGSLGELRQPRRHGDGSRKRATHERAKEEVRMTYDEEERLLAARRQVTADVSLAKSIVELLAALPPDAVEATLKDTIEGILKLVLDSLTRRGREFGEAVDRYNLSRQGDRSGPRRGERDA